MEEEEEEREEDKEEEERRRREEGKSKASRPATPGAPWPGAQTATAIFWRCPENGSLRPSPPLPSGCRDVHLPGIKADPRHALAPADPNPGPPGVRALARMPGMGSRIKCLVRGGRGKRSARFLKRCLLKMVRKVARSKPLPHTLVLTVKGPGPRPSPPQDAEEVMQMSPVDKYPLQPTVRGAFQLQAKATDRAPCSSSEEVPSFQQTDLSMV